MRKPILLTQLLCTVFSGCTEAGSRDEELVHLRTVLPESLLEYAHLDVGSRKSIAILGEGQDRHLGLHVFPGQDKVHGGIRAEISVGYPFQQGETVRYSWRFKLPEDFISDAPMNRWWVIGQWHDQPNKKLGETWETFRSLSPPVLLGLGELEGKSAISLSYGPTSDGRKLRNFGPIFVERGKWHTITCVIRWSQGPDGKASVFLNDLSKPAMTAEGPNMNNDYEHYLKLGMYRHPDIATDNWIYVDDIQISKMPAPLR
jgi:Polysaccharide lyase